MYCILFPDNNTLTPIISCDIERMDINLLKGQTLRVKISSVDLTASKFYVTLIPSATKCENIINTYMADKNSEVCCIHIQIDLIILLKNILSVIVLSTV